MSNIEKLADKRRVKPVRKSAVAEILEEQRKLEEEREAEDMRQIKEEFRKADWDVCASEPVRYFDANLSYEITGYKPIDGTHGLDFDPSWFTEVRETFLRTGHYSAYHRGTKAYADFWDREYSRCQDGMTVNGYTVTGDHYFFLNYYQLMDLTSAKKSGSSRLYSFPRFFVAQYLFFHYVEMARVLRKNAVLMKARGIGYSEINASILANAYNCRHDSINILAASFEKYLTKTLDKVWAALNWLNDKTDGGFFKLRQVADTATLKRASHYKIENGQKIEEGWMSQVQGILADTPNKIRGDRADLLVYEELGSWPNSKKAFIQGDALVGIQGNRFGLKLGGGTGGDTGAALAGLRDMYRNPDVYDILEYKHNYTASGETTYSSYFIPATTLVDREDCTDSRGWTDPKKGKAYYDGERAKKAKDPEALLTYSAEYCYNAEEAFSLEGNNNFDKVILAEQLTAIRVTKTAPPVEKGTLSYTYSSPNHTFQNVSGYKWIESPSGKVQILEHPIWTDLYKSQQEMIRQSYQEKGMRYEPPVYDNVMNNLYVAGIDSIDIGAEDTSENTDNPSMFCIVIMKRQFGMQDPVIVAYYKDRPQHIRDAYKMAMCMVTYYQAIVNIEATRMNLYAWAREQGYYRYFMMRPRATYPDPNKIGKRTPGTPATPTIILHLLALIEAYVEDYGQHIWFEDILDELNRYSFEQKTHFDAVAALGMVMLANEELGDIVATKAVTAQDVGSFVDIGYYYDEKGYKRFGAIPKPRAAPQVKMSLSDLAARTSDPRTWEGYNTDI